MRLCSFGLGEGIGDQSVYFLGWAPLAQASRCKGSNLFEWQRIQLWARRCMRSVCLRKLSDGTTVGSLPRFLRVSLLQGQGGQQGVLYPQSVDFVS